MENHEGYQHPNGQAKLANAVQSVPQKVQQAEQRERSRSYALGLTTLLLRPVQSDFQPAGEQRQTLEKACLSTIVLFF